MIIPVRCFTCGKMLSDKYNYYNKELLRRKIALQTTDTKQAPNLSPNPEVTQPDDPIVISITAKEVKKTIVGEIMDELGLTRDCCRKNMMTNINIIEDV